MAGIKIINVLKDDRFEDVLFEFKKAEAEEVILVLPKNSVLAKAEANFVALASETASSGKTITVMTADQRAREYSQKYGFKFLASPHSESIKKRRVGPAEKELSAEVAEEPQAEDEELAEVPDADEDQIVADLTLAAERNRKMSDIRHSHEVSPLAIQKSKEKSSAVEIKYKAKLDKIDQMWLKKDSSQSVWSNLKFFRRPKIQSANRRTAKTNSFLAAGILIAVILILYFTLGSAQITLKPQKQKLNFDLAIAVSSAYSQISASEKKLPGQLLSDKAEVSKDFVATGQKQVAQKARSSLTIYNNYGSDPQTFVATTRFQSSNGLIFRTPRLIIVPGAKLVAGKLTPGSIEVAVIADKPGPEYNINPDRFSIPGLKGSPKYNGFYAQSEKKFSGGMIGLSKVVTEKDFTEAKENVAKEALEKAQQNLKTKLNQLKIIEPVETQIVSLQSTAEADEAAEGFAIKATAEAKTIGFLEKDLQELIRKFISKDQEMILLTNALVLNYKNAKIDWEKKTLTFSVGVQGEAAAKVDEEKIVSNLLGMKQAKIKEYLLGIKEIESAKILLSPFWIRMVPKDRGKVKLQLIY